MKKIPVLIIVLILCNTRLKAQANAFDSRFENHSKSFKLQGRVKKLTEVDSVSKMKYVHPKEKIEYTLLWLFKPDGNYTEKTEYRGDGSIAARDVLTYDNKNQLTKIVHSSGPKEQWSTICTVDMLHNHVTSESFLPGRPLPFVSYEKIYNKQGKVIKFRATYPPKPTETRLISYNAGINTTIESDGTKVIDKYDQNNFLVETLCYDSKGKLTMDELYKNDEWGNIIEEKSGIKDEGPEVSYTSYVYDDHHNWIQKTIKGESWSKIVTRTIEYY